MKYFDKSDRYTDLGTEIEYKVINALQPIVDEYAENGSIRELQVIITNAMMDVILEKILNNRYLDNRY